MATCRSCEAVAHGRMSLMGDGSSWQHVDHVRRLLMAGCR